MVRLLRAVRDWKQEELSRRSGVQRALISQYEREEQIPSTAQLERLAAAAGIPVSLVEGFARAALERLGEGAGAAQAPRSEVEVPEPSLAEGIGRRVAAVLAPILTPVLSDEVAADGRSGDRASATE